jgi:hypothetical protein
MRRMQILSFLVGVLLLSLGANGLPDGATQELSKERGNLPTVHAEVVRQSYCHVDDEAFSAFLDLRLRFTNTSDHSMILARTIESPPIVRVARNLEAAQRNDFLYAPNSDFFVADIPDAPPVGEAPDPKLVVLLPAGAGFETVVQTAVVGANDAAKATKGTGLLAKGSYVLQVGIDTWPYEWPYFRSKTDSHELRRRWTKYGDLVTGLVYSDFAPFTLSERFKDPRCPLPQKRKLPER